MTSKSDNLPQTSQDRPSRLDAQWRIGYYLPHLFLQCTTGCQKAMSGKTSNVRQNKHRTWNVFSLIPRNFLRMEGLTKSVIPGDCNTKVAPREHGIGDVHSAHVGAVRRSFSGGGHGRLHWKAGSLAFKNTFVSNLIDLIKIYSPLQRFGSALMSKVGSSRTCRARVTRAVLSGRVCNPHAIEWISTVLMLFGDMLM